jgi:hypothetical protein
MVDQEVENKISRVEGTCLPSSLIVKQENISVASVDYRIADWLEKMHAPQMDIKDPWPIQMPGAGSAYIVSCGSSILETWRPALVVPQIGASAHVRLIYGDWEGIQGCALSLHQEGTRLHAFAQTTCFEPGGSIHMGQGEIENGEIGFKEPFRKVMGAEDFVPIFQAGPEEIFLYDPKILKVDKGAAMYVTAGKIDTRAGTYRENIHGGERHRVAGQTYMAVSESGFEGPYKIEPEPVIPAAKLPFFNQLGENNYVWGHEATFSGQLNNETELIYIAGHLRDPLSNGIRHGELQRGVFLARHRADSAQYPTVIGFPHTQLSGEYGAGCFEILPEENILSLTYQSRDGDGQPWHMRRTDFHLDRFTKHVEDVLGR